MVKWEYMVENWTMPIHSGNREEFEKELNEYGKDGWELVTNIPQTSNSEAEFPIFHQLVFKRKINEA